MKIWYHKLNESQRTLIETDETLISIGRNPSNVIQLSSPLISQKQAIVHCQKESLKLKNIGLNSCLIGDSELIGGESKEFSPGETIRIWPYTLTFESEQIAQLSPKDVESHLRSQLSDLELQVHEILLQRFDLYELGATRAGNEENILLLEKHIDDICLELNLFDTENNVLLEEMCRLIFSDLIINQLILDNKQSDLGFHNYLTHNEFDVPTTLVTERETELASLLHFAMERLQLSKIDDLTLKIKKVEDHYESVFPQIRPSLHDELKKYLIRRTLKKDLKDTVFGFGPLQDLLRAPTISEIMVVTSDLIYIERDGVLELSGRRFLSDKVTESIVERIVSDVGRRIDKSQPLVDARLPDGSRVNAIIPPLATRGPSLTIRKFPAHRLMIDNLVEYETLTEVAALFLRACVIGRRNILISGGTGTGKTTLLNVLSGFVPYKERIVSIEDTSELKLHQEHVVGLESRSANVEGSGEYTIRDLVRNALRMRPDRIVVGECRGPEALDMLQAMNTGHDGSMTTLHANNTKDALQRLEVLVLMAAELPLTSIQRQIASAIDLIVQINRVPGGRRKITQISEVTGYDEERKEINVLDIFRLKNGSALHPTGYLPSFVDALIEQDLLKLEFLFGADANSLQTVKN